MERTNSVWSDRNIRDQLWRWSTVTGLVISVSWAEISLSIWQIVVPSTALLYPGYKNKNQTRGALGRVCATWLYRFIGHVKFPTFQTVEWKAPPNSTVRPTGWAIELHPFKPFLRTKPIHHTGLNSLENWQNEKELIFQVLNGLFRKLYGDQEGEFVCGYWGLTVPKIMMTRVWHSVDLFLLLAFFIV